MHAPKTHKAIYIYMNQKKKQFLTDLVCVLEICAQCLLLNQKKKPEKKKVLKAASFSLQDTGQYLQSYCISIYEEEERERIAREAFYFYFISVYLRRRRKRKDHCEARFLVFFFFASFNVSWVPLFSRFSLLNCCN